MPVSPLHTAWLTVRLVRTLGTRSPAIYLEVTQAFTLCSRDTKIICVKTARGGKAILLTSSCTGPTANRRAESVVCPYMECALLPPSAAPSHPKHHIKGQTLIPFIISYLLSSHSFYHLIPLLSAFVSFWKSHLQYINNKFKSITHSFTFYFQAALKSLKVILKNAFCSFLYF